MHHRRPDPLPHRDSQPCHEPESDELRDASREPVAGDHEPDDRPREVHDEHVATRQPSLAVGQGGEERAGGGR